MKHARIERIPRVRTKRIAMESSCLPIDKPGKYPMARAIRALELEGKDTAEAVRWIVAYGVEQAIAGEFRFLKEILDTIDGPAVSCHAIGIAHDDLMDSTFRVEEAA